VTSNPKKVTTLRDLDKEGAKGTPLYMPPEVMQGKEFDEKADVYSYAMCLWEIYTCKDLFPDHNDYDVFVRAVCKKNERPPMPDNTLPSLKKLIEDCWDGNASHRPSFSDINDRLDEILVEAAIPDDAGREFWKKHFLKTRNVSWNEFSKAFYKFLGLTPVEEHDEKKSKKAASLEPTPEIKRMRHFRDVLAQSEGTNRQERTLVEIQHFGRVLGWFGPLVKGSKSNTIMNTVEEVCNQSWFHGDIDAIEAGTKLHGGEPGLFLVRFSTSSVGGFTISRVTEEGKILHVKIDRTSKGGFVLQQEFKTLPELIHYASDKLFLRVPAPGSRFYDVPQQAMYAPVISRPGH